MFWKICLPNEYSFLDCSSVYITITFVLPSIPSSFLYLLMIHNYCAITKLCPNFSSYLSIAFSGLDFLLVCFCLLVWLFWGLILFCFKYNLIPPPACASWNGNSKYRYVTDEGCNTEHTWKNSSVNCKLEFLVFNTGFVASVCKRFSDFLINVPAFTNFIHNLLVLLSWNRRHDNETAYISQFTFFSFKIIHNKTLR